MKTALIIGLLHSYHVSTPELDKLHPVVEYGHIMYYNNSFNKDAIAVFNKYNLTKNLNFRLGLTTGYSPKMIKDNKVYTVPFAISDNLALFAVPSYDIEINKKLNFTSSIAGNAITLGLTYILN